MSTINKVLGVLVIVLLIIVIIIVTKSTNKSNVSNISNVNTSVNNSQPSYQLAKTRQYQKYPDNTEALVGYQYDYEYPNYSDYYISDNNPDRINSDTCLALPRESSDCVNRRLVRNGDNLQDAVNVCRVQQTVLDSCARHENGYYYPYDIENPFYSNYEEPQTKEAYVIRTSLNAPKENTVMIKVNDSI